MIADQLNNAVATKNLALLKAAMSAAEQKGFTAMAAYTSAKSAIKAIVRDEVNRAVNSDDVATVEAALEKAAKYGMQSEDFYRHAQAELENIPRRQAMRDLKQAKSSRRPEEVMEQLQRSKGKWEKLPEYGQLVGHYRKLKKLPEHWEVKVAVGRVDVNMKEERKAHVIAHFQRIMDNSFMGIWTRDRRIHGASVPKRLVVREVSRWRTSRTTLPTLAGGRRLFRS